MRVKCICAKVMYNLYFCVFRSNQPLVVIFLACFGSLGVRVIHSRVGVPGVADIRRSNRMARLGNCIHTW